MPYANPSHLSLNPVTPARLVQEIHSLAAVIDHTLLKPEATSSEVEQLCKEAHLYTFASVCINPFRVPLAVSLLSESPVKVCTVVGFPLGANSMATKAEEANLACIKGAHEIDMVMNIGALMDADFAAVQQDVAGVARVVRDQGKLLKVIFETCLLNDSQKSAACRISVDAGADFVKTSTGFSKSGATVEDIRLMRAAVGPEIGVKASGGIRTLATLKGMLDAGASRIGTSSGVSILNELRGLGATSPAGNY
jgi:deoxyribose-phosphate aldolase